MKHELLYETQAQFTEAEGRSGNVTSITPGVAYVNEGGSVAFNKPCDTLIVVYQVDDVSSPTKLYNASGIKTNLKQVFIDKEDTPISSLTTEHLFSKTGLHSVLYRYSVLENLPVSGFTGCANIVSIFFADSIKIINGECFSGCYGIKNLLIPINVGNSAFDKSGSGFGRLTILGNLNCAKAYAELGYREVEITGDVLIASTSNRYLVDISRSNYVESIKIHGNLTIQTDGVDRTLLGYSTGRKPGSVKFIEIGGNVILTSGSGRMFQNGTVFHADGAILHFPKPEVVCSPSVCNASFNRLTKIYVGDGSSQAHDQQILDAYLADENWSSYASKLDLWYNYHGEYREE